MKKKIDKDVNLYVTVKDCDFSAVRLDASVVNTIQTIADGFLENAKGLRTLANFLKGQNVHVDSMLKFEKNNIADFIKND